MKRIKHIISIITACLLAEAVFVSCIYDDIKEPSPANICVNTMALDGSRSSADNNNFAVLFWKDFYHLEFSRTRADVSEIWKKPYYAAHAPQEVDFYSSSVFDTRYPYPAEKDDNNNFIYIYATGYSPADVLTKDNDTGYKNLTADITDSRTKGNYDFLGCDSWSEVYKGSFSDPFAQDKNRLYFRHLAAKLVIYADRDRETMENKQFVRNVQIKNLRMSINDKDGKPEWIPMHTPKTFEWGDISEGVNFADEYSNIITKVKEITGNSNLTYPKNGYVVWQSDTFATGINYVLERNAVDRVPIDGMAIDSCYVCNPTDNGEASAANAIKLKMDISAELSYDFNFPQGDNTSTTDDITFTRVWKDVELDAIYEVASVDKNGNATLSNTKVTQFKPGKEYRIYITFNRTGVNLVARELPWNYGGIHYITISGGTTTPTQPENKN